MTAAVPGPEPIDYDAKLAAFDSVPLFMRNLPVEGQSSVELDALQSLVFDGTPNEIARNFKEQGNEYFKGARYREALGFYTQGIDARPDDEVLKETLYCNRAACNLELRAFAQLLRQSRLQCLSISMGVPENYRSTLHDCADALEVNAHSSKALFRSARALVALERYDEGLECCRLCLGFDKDNRVVQLLAENIEGSILLNAQKAEAKQRLQKDAKVERELLLISCAARHLSFLNTNAPDKPGFPMFDPTAVRPYTPTTQIIFPVFLLYPQYNTSDFIAQFAEHVMFGDHLSIVFPEGGPPPVWDANWQYRVRNLAIYVTTRQQRLLKVGRKMSLADVFLRAGVIILEGVKEVQDGLEIRDGCLSFVAVTKGDAENKYIADFKAKRDGKGTS